MAILTYQQCVAEQRRYYESKSYRYADEAPLCAWRAIWSRACQQADEVMTRLNAVAEDIYRQILEIRKRGDRPMCVRVGLLEYYELARESRSLEGPLQLRITTDGRTVQEVFGVPLVRVGLDHYLGVLPVPRR